MTYNIAMVAAEVKPYCKIGGVADVVTDLSSALINEGHSVKVVTYDNTNLREGIGSRKVESAGHVDVPLGGSPVRFEVGTVARNGAPTVYVLRNKDHTSVDDAVYPVKETDAERYGTKYATFSSAAAHLIATHPDFKDTRIAHLHDYQAAVTAPVLKTSLQWTGGILQTLHNIGYGPRCDAFQGVYDPSVLAFVGLSSLFHIDGFEYHGRANFLKGGCLFADATSCVSERYAQEILRENYGGGLEGVMRKVMPRGVVNGIDTQDPHFRPDAGEAIRYDKGYNIADAKRTNRRQLNGFLRAKGEKMLDTDRPTIGVVARLTEQKFTNMLADNGAHLEEILSLPINVMMAAAGNNKSPLYATMEELEKKHRNLVWLRNGPLFNDKKEQLTFDATAQLVYASSDFLLNPALYEPCGLTQLIGMQFGTIPIVTSEGGLRNTVIDFSNAHQHGNGFIINPNTPEEMVRTVKKALVIAAPRSRVHKEIVQNCMTADHSWKSRLPAYYELYEAAIRGKR